MTESKTLMKRIRQLLGLLDPETYREAEKIAERAIAKKKRDYARHVAESQTVPPEETRPSGGVDHAPSPW